MTLNIWVLKFGAERRGRGDVIFYWEWKVRSLGSRARVATASREHRQTNGSLQRTFMDGINILSSGHHDQLTFSSLRTSCSGASQRRARHIWDLAQSGETRTLWCSNVGVRRKPAVCSTVIQCLLHDPFTLLFQAFCENQPCHPQSLLHRERQPQGSSQDSSWILWSNPRTRYVYGNALLLHVASDYCYSHSPRKHRMFSLRAASKWICPDRSLRKTFVNFMAS